LIDLRRWTAIELVELGTRVGVLRGPSRTFRQLRLLCVSEKARRWKGTDERLLGRHGRGARRSGRSALDSRRQARYQRTVFTLHHPLHTGGCSEAIDLRATGDRLRHGPGQVGRLRNIERQYQRVGTRTSSKRVPGQCTKSSIAPCAFQIHGQARSCQAGARSAGGLGRTRSILLANLSRRLLLCLLRLQRWGQGSRRESRRIPGAWERDAGSTAIEFEEVRNDRCSRRAR